MKMKKWLIEIFVLMVFCIGTVCAMKNPAAVYCNALGYEYVTTETPEGSIGVCKFTESSNCEGWTFLSGKCGQEQSYCKKNGYEIKTVTDFEKCSDLFTEECAVCVLSDGNEVEVTKLMKLNFSEGVCGDGSCVLGESYATCPEDCPSGSFDGYCDGVKDGICDPDCSAGEDSDCKAESTTTTIGVICDNGKCEYGENFANCPQDCKSGGSDNYCDGESDTICDPDCKPEFDADCKTDLCGNVNCDISGGENFGNCPQDCSSGGKDSYCDGITDGKCDSDCSQDEDSDCKRTDFSLYLLLLIVLFVVIAIIFFLRKRRREY